MALTNREKSILRYKRYEKIRDGKGYKDIDVARGAEIYPSILSDWKNGRATPALENAVKIANFLGVPANDFIVAEE